MSHYYILENRIPVPISSITDPRVLAAFEDVEMRRVAKTVIGRLTVYTSFIVINHNWFGGPPLVFETMICDKIGRWLDFQERYSTYEQAEYGHQEAIAFAETNQPKRAEMYWTLTVITCRHYVDKVRYWFRVKKQALNLWIEGWR